MTVRTHFSIDACTYHRGRLTLVSGPMSLMPSHYTRGQVLLLEQLIADRLCPVAHLEIGDDGSVTLASVEATLAEPTVNCTVRGEA